MAINSKDANTFQPERPLSGQHQSLFLFLLNVHVDEHLYKKYSFTMSYSLLVNT